MCMWSSSAPMPGRSRPCCTWCPCSSLPTTPLSRAAPTSTSRAIWPSRSPWNNLRPGQKQEKTVRLNSIVIALGALIAAPAQAQTEIHWWHSMGGALGEKVNELATKFNASQKDYKVLTVYKGQYPESMTAAIAAFRAGNAPHILQVFEVGTATMMAAKGAIVPVAKVMTDAGEPFDAKAYLPTVSGYYTDLKRNLLSFPFNSSTALFYTNDDALKKAGLEPVAPNTWKEFGAVADKLKGAGQQCV